MTLVESRELIRAGCYYPAPRPNGWGTVKRCGMRLKIRRLESIRVLLGELIIALPRELTPGEQQQLLEGYLLEQFVDRGMVADFNIHDTHTGNPYTHVMLTTREVTASGFGDKVELLQEWREAWADHCNAALEDSGQAARVDHRTLFMQGIDREPTRHHGIPGKLLHHYRSEQPITPPTVHPPTAPPVRTTRQAAQDFDTGFLAALARPIGRAGLSDMDALNARTVGFSEEPIDLGCRGEDLHGHYRHEPLGRLSL